MAWFDGVKYESLKTWVPTSGVVPRGAVHAVARLKGAILKEVVAAKTAGDQVGYQWGWKAITFLDRMLFAEARGGRRKQRNATKAELVTSRVRRAWRGDWGGLYAEAEGMGLRGQGGSQTGTGDDIKADVRAVEA